MIIFHSAMTSRAMRCRTARARKSKRILAASALIALYASCILAGWIAGGKI